MLVDERTFYRHAKKERSAHEEGVSGEESDVVNEEESEEENEEESKDSEDGEFEEGELAELIGEVESWPEIPRFDQSTKGISKMVKALLQCHIEFSGKQNQMTKVLEIFKEGLRDFGVDQDTVAKFPTTFNQAVAGIKSEFGERKIVDVCPTCEHFYTDHLQSNCPSCGTSRYHPDSKLPLASFHILPITSRLVKLAENPVSTQSNIDAL